MKIRALFLCFTSTLLLSACNAPRYETKYELVVPPSPSGKECANQCYHRRGGCVDSCEHTTRDCRAHARMSAHIGYGTHGWTNHGFGVGYGYGYDPLYYPDYYCPAPDECIEHCEADYRACFEGCGGKVIPHTSCVENCEQQ